MTATPALTTDLKAQVKLLADDLRQRLEDDPVRLADWKRTHHEAQTKERTAMSWVEWREDRIDQAAVAWVLTTVFIRFCEDNFLVKPVWFTGPGRRQEALDGYNAYFRANPKHSDREWLESAVAYLRKLPVTKALVDAHSALEYVSPSGDAVGKLREFWLRRDDDGELIHDLHDESLSTRFLGDLYQDLSDYAKKMYALLQTPVFVEEHILDQTLEPALNDRPLDGFRMIDPTCGSGHFLLGAFDRLLDRWHKYAPGMETQARVQTALDAIHGVDLNPFAVAIARFRLTVAALKACELRSLEASPAFKFHLATGDSLIHGPDPNALPGMMDRSAFMSFHYTTEDGSLLMEILDEGRYDAVVGNPPYIQPHDKALNHAYRSKFGRVCKGKYALTVPFIVQFFSLAKRGEEAGWVGQITSNSFMKREFGSAVIEEYLPTKDLQLIEDTSGAIIPGHSTGTVVLVGRNRAPRLETVRAVLKVKGESPNGGDPANGKYWLALVAHVDSPGWSDEWITVRDIERSSISVHPWTLEGGGALELRKAIEDATSRRLRDIAAEVGIVAVIGEEDAFELTPRSPEPKVSFVIGENVRDYMATGIPRFWPYDREYKITSEALSSRHMWPYRTLVSGYVMFGKTRAQRGLPWVAYGMLATAKLQNPYSIAYAEIATHNHFVLKRGPEIFGQTAPVIKLPIESSEEEHLELLGVLNSSTICFWLKQVCFSKGNATVSSGIPDQPWSWNSAFNSSNVAECPIPKGFPSWLGRELDELSKAEASTAPSAIVESMPITSSELSAAKHQVEQTRARMISIQEELDWRAYYLYRLIDEDLTYPGDDLPEIALGQRAFEIALAQSGEQAGWFERHGSTPITEIPEFWPSAYRELVRRRLELITVHPYIKLLEKPEYKRRWQQEPWEKLQEKALRGWLLNRLDNRRFWFDSQGRPRTRSMAQLADDVTRDSDMVSVFALWEQGS
jgi:hypothetical protein